MRARFFLVLTILFTISNTCGLHAIASSLAGSKTSRGESYSTVTKRTPQNSSYQSGKVVVKLAAAGVGNGITKGAGFATISTFVQRYGSRSFSQLFTESVISREGRSVDLSRYYILEYASPVDAFVVAEELSSLPEIEFAEPCFAYRVSSNALVIPNDTAYYRQWHLGKIKADTAWSVNQGDPNTVIGIVDTGVQWDHPDLQGHIWVNPGEDGPDGLGGDKRTNGLDDDGNGKPDDWRGWDFVGGIFGEINEDNNPSPTAVNNAHGTHVAGIAGAVTNNVTGIASISYNCRILPIKASADNDNDPSGVSIFTIPAFRGIVYSAQMGADVINLSWGGPGASQFEQDMVDSATALGALIVAAAGNTGTAAELQYPASYRNVLSVAATQQGGDIKASYSSYNEMVDVAAPGGAGSAQIYSTYYPNTYASNSGTSMASPLVAGVAALVRTQFPGLTPSQAAEQLRVTCDTAIYTANSSFRYKLGKGLVNAFRALTDSLKPAVRMTNLIGVDSPGGNNNGSFEPNEDIRLTTTFTNFLRPTTSAMVYLSTTDPGISVTSGTFALGALGTMSSIDNSLAPFTIHVNSGIGAARVVTFTLRISDGAYSDIQQFTLLFNPTFATHTINNVDVTLANNGRIGFNDLNNNLGVGFVFGNGNQLYEGGLLIGYSATKIVNCVRTDVASPPQDNDFASSQIYSLVTPGTISSQDGSTVFNDNGATTTNRVGVQVGMHSYAFDSAPDDDYIILHYDITNTSGSTLSNLYVGLFFDWDMLAPGSVLNPWTHNRAAFDAGRNMGYAWYDTNIATVHAGVRALEGASAYRGLLLESADPDRAHKWDWISGGIVPNDTTGDVHFTISSGPYTISAGGAVRVAFALIGGDDLTDLQANSDAAQSKWSAIKTALAVGDKDGALPTAYALHQNYPNPFNPATTIAFDIPTASDVSIRIYDLLGRRVATISDNFPTEPGRHRVQFDGSTLPSGAYFCEIRATSSGQGRRETYSAMKKIMLLR